jgi:hypothetical protein
MSCRRVGHPIGGFRRTPSVSSDRVTISVASSASARTALTRVLRPGRMWLQSSPAGAWLDSRPGGAPSRGGAGPVDAWFVSAMSEAGASSGRSKRLARSLDVEHRSELRIAVPGTREPFDCLPSRGMARRPTPPRPSERAMSRAPWFVAVAASLLFHVVPLGAWVVGKGHLEDDETSGPKTAADDRIDVSDAINPDDSKEDVRVGGEADRSQGGAALEPEKTTIVRPPAAAAPAVDEPVAHPSAAAPAIPTGGSAPRNDERAAPSAATAPRAPSAPSTSAPASGPAGEQPGEGGGPVARHGRDLGKAFTFELATHSDTIAAWKDLPMGSAGELRSFIDVDADGKITGSGIAPKTSPPPYLYEAFQRAVRATLPPLALEGGVVRAGRLEVRLEAKLVEVAVPAGARLEFDRTFEHGVGVAAFTYESGLRVEIAVSVQRDSVD